MIRSITVDGYKGLVGTSVRFNGEGPTVLLGPNGSGKSTILEVVETLAQLASKQLGETRLSGNEFARVAYQGDPQRAISFRAELPTFGGKARGIPAVDEWFIEIRRGEIVREALGGSPEMDRDARGRAGMRPTISAPLYSNPEWGHSDQPPTWLVAAARVARAVGPVRSVRFQPRRIAESCPPSSQVAPDGFGIPAALLHHLTSDRKQFGRLERRFTKLFPWVEEVLPELGSDPSGKPVVHLKFRERGSRHPYPADDASSGMLLALALLWTTVRSEPERILCFDEPENSMHPYLLREAYELLGKASRGELAREDESASENADADDGKVQVLIATHSVDFVNLCGPEEVRICERNDAGVVGVHPVTERGDLAEAIKNYEGALGELWYSGALGGIPKNRPAAGPR